jgi:NAD(P)-dependent dehydrogenase (short-subunit alcohol dehydrogenase family)
VSKAAEAQGIIDAAIKNYGHLDILVNNSGFYEFAPIEAVTEEHFHKIFNVNALGAVLTTQAAVEHLGEGASIINIGSGVSPSRPHSPRFTRARKARLMPSLEFSPMSLVSGKFASIPLMQAWSKQKSRYSSHARLGLRKNPHGSSPTRPHR